MAPNVPSWRTILSHNNKLETRASSTETGKTQRDQFLEDTVRSSKVCRVDQELAELRAAPIQMFNERRRCVIQVDIGRFHANSVSFTFEGDKLLIKAEEEVPLNESTTVVKKMVRRVAVPVDSLRTDIMASQVNALGILTLTFLKK